MAHTLSLPKLSVITTSVQAIAPTITPKNKLIAAIVTATALVVIAAVVTILQMTHQGTAQSQGSSKQTNKASDNSFAPDLALSQPMNTDQNTLNTASFDLNANSNSSNSNSVAPQRPLWSGIAQAYLPGNPMPSTMRCGAATNGARECLSRQITGYSLVQMTVDANTGIIRASTFYVSGVLVKDLTAKWGQPTRTSTANHSSVLYWQGYRAYLTSNKIDANDRVDFITFD